MMKLSLMKRFYDTVENMRSPVLDAIAGRWFESCEAMTHRASANFVARVAHGESTYFLRFNHESERSTGHIRAELEYINHLLAHGINANVPVPSLSGSFIENVDTVLGVFHAVMFKEVPGVHIESDDLDISGFRLWGQALARVHEAGENHEISGAPSWADHMNAIKAIAKDNPVIISEIRKLENVLASYQQTGNYGLIPFDFEMDNIKWVDNSPGFMDFDDFCIHWHAADIAYALRDLHGDRMTGFNPDDPRFSAFMEGYRWVKGVSNEELERIPVFIRLHNLHMYSRIKRAVDDEPENDEPDWVINLRDKLRSKNESYLRDMAENPL
jgi:Ser/Thr protein kinase RdoA (MazF antagonist)